MKTQVRSLKTQVRSLKTQVRSLKTQVRSDRTRKAIITWLKSNTVQLRLKTM
ncbi:MAG: hypothetical protein KME28_04420 [Pelatocladus maniniholoensis HA4357-MV3]|uniref:Uncharacterized protein n=1 Tax=Pelatocladus maniniholoensis HA4357-MV3 TaxID=1117104 RepID=A0A9E3H4P5_9NOST|nr:hypothetical protein [Pelatocladus maniniholoensis HA4357-MV3]